jgi:hypothetical protein
MPRIRQLIVPPEGDLGGATDELDGLARRSTVDSSLTSSRAQAHL